MKILCLNTVEIMQLKKRREKEERPLISLIDAQVMGGSHRIALNSNN